MAPAIETTRIGISGMPATAPAAATAIRMGVPGTRIPNTATASATAAVKAMAMVSSGYCAARSAAPLISDHTSEAPGPRSTTLLSHLLPAARLCVGTPDEWKQFGDWPRVSYRIVIPLHGHSSARLDPAIL